MRRRATFLALVLVAFFVRHAVPAEAGSYQWNLPKGFPVPHVPADNPMTAAKVELGRHLFYDTRLSVNGKFSCATCHKQELAFTDGRPVGVGATGQLHSRGAMSLVNVAYAGALTWADPRMKNLEDQALVPMFGGHPVELGLHEDTLPAEAGFRCPVPRPLRPGISRRAERVTVQNITRAIACFERSIISARSPYDRYHYGGDDNAVSDSAKRGEVLFFSRQLSCFRCHGGFNFSDATVSAANAGREIPFHNTGLSADTREFKTPTLRNIAVTAPYMHNGSIATLDGVLDHYASGGRGNPQKDPLIAGFALSRQDRADLVAFLETLTDQAILHDPRFANPW